MWSLQLASFIQDVFEVQPFCSMYCLLISLSFFNVGHFKVRIEFVTVLPLFYILSIFLFIFYILAPSHAGS